MGFIGYPVGGVGSTPTLGGPGLALVTTVSFSAVSSVSVNGCFTALHHDYQILMQIKGTVDTNIQMRWRAAGADLSSASSYSAGGVRFGSTGDPNTATDTSMTIGSFDDNVINAHTYIDAIAYSPATGNYPTLRSVSVGGMTLVAVMNPWTIASRTNATYTADGFTVYPATGTITGSLAVYGYRKER